MASDFIIEQNGANEIVTAYISVADGSYTATDYHECGMYVLNISHSTPSGNPVSFNWMDYITVRILDGTDRQLLQNYTKNTAMNIYSLSIKANISNLSSCQLIENGLIFPNGEMDCDDIHPSGIATIFWVYIKSTDESKVVIDKNNDTFLYTVPG